MKTTKLLLLAAITAWIVVIGAVMTSCSSDDDTPIGSTIIENENGKEELDLNGELMVYAQTGYIYDAIILYPKALRISIPMVSGAHPSKKLLCRMG